MATLSQITQETRMLLKYGVIALLGIFLLIIVINVGMTVKNILAPTPAAPPTVAFGKLPQVVFPSSANNSSMSYAINTLTGVLPTLPDRVNVYKFQQSDANLLALDKAKQMASSIGFTDSPLNLSDTAYQWTKTDPFSSNLTINTQSFDFSFYSSFITDPTVTQAAFLPDEQSAISFSQNFFTTISPLPDSIDSSKTKTTLFAISHGALIPATSFSNAQIIRVDFFPKDIDSHPLYTLNPSTSLIYDLVASGQTSNPQIVEAQLIHKDVSSTKATYPIKTANEAYADLKNGKGFIAANPNNVTSVSITNVSLGYFLSTEQQDFLMPIIVFQADNGFFAYVGAIKDEWTRN